MEIWRDIPGYEGRYQVSNEGRVQSLDRYVDYADGRRRRYAGRVLKLQRLRSGHLSVSLGYRPCKDVHQLVLRAFIGPPPERHECLHMDDDPTNNRLINLRWGTRSENVKMSFASGTRRPKGRNMRNR